MHLIIPPLFSITLYIACTGSRILTWLDTPFSFEARPRCVLGPPQVGLGIFRIPNRRAANTSVPGHQLTEYARISPLLRWGGAGGGQKMYIYICLVGASSNSVLIWSSPTKKKYEKSVYTVGNPPILIHF